MQKNILHLLYYTFCVIKGIMRFLRKHKIGTPPSVQRLADSLCEKGLLNAETSLHSTEYMVNDVFFSHWLERL